MKKKLIGIICALSVLVIMCVVVIVILVNKGDETGKVNKPSTTVNPGEMTELDANFSVLQGSFYIKEELGCTLVTFREENGKKYFEYGPYGDEPTFGGVITELSNHNGTYNVSYDKEYIAVIDYNDDVITFDNKAYVRETKRKLADICE